MRGSTVESEQTLHPLIQSDAGEREQIEYIERFLRLQRRTLGVMKVQAMGALTWQQAWVLFDLLDQPLAMSRIAQIRKVTPGTATSVVARLVSRGLVERYHPETNRRFTMVRLTASGRATAVQIHQRLEAIFTFRDGGGDAERQSWLVQQLIASLESIFPEETPFQGPWEVHRSAGGGHNAPGGQPRTENNRGSAGFGERIARVMRTVSRTFREVPQSTDLASLTLDQVWLLDELLYGPMSMGQVTSFRTVSYTTAEELTSRLVSRGLLERVRAKGVGRVAIQLTAAGRQVATQIHQGVCQIMVRNTSPFTPERRRQLLQAVLILEELFPEDSPPWRRRASRVDNRSPHGVHRLPADK